MLCFSAIGGSGMSPFAGVGLTSQLNLSPVGTPTLREQPLLSGGGAPMPATASKLRRLRLRRISPAHMFTHPLEERETRREQAQQ